MNVGVGFQALFSGTASNNNVAIGENAMALQASFSNNNIAIGSLAMYLLPVLFPILLLEPRLCNLLLPQVII